MIPPRPMHALDLTSLDVGDQLESGELFQGLGKPTVGETIRLRCPSCYKLYAVDSSEIRESRPRFHCQKCHTQFWIPFPEAMGQVEVIGLREEQPSTPTKFKEHEPSLGVTAKQKNCPKCEAPYGYGETECARCGVVFAKVQSRDSEASVPSSPQLRRLWFQVVDEYDSLERHRRFIRACQVEGNLPYASQQYRRVLLAHAGDETALQMQKEIAALAEVQSGLKTNEASTWKFAFPRVTTLLMLAAALMIGIGLSTPLARNLVGLGVALLFFVSALRWYVRSS